MHTIYVIEDDESIRELISVALTGFGYYVEGFPDAEKAFVKVVEKLPALFIVDLMLPGMDGLTFIQKIKEREITKKIPVLVLTARERETDKVKTLDAGADDYMVKPFGILELGARIKALLRRTEGREEVETQGIKKAGALVINNNARQVSVDGKPVNLTFKEYELLLYMVERKDRVIDREELLLKLWGCAGVETRTLDIHVRTLRQKLGEYGKQYIHTVRKVGYEFCTK